MLPGSDLNEVHLGVYQATDRNQGQLKATKFDFQSNRGTVCASASRYTSLPCYPWFMSHRGAGFSSEQGVYQATDRKEER
jgi:hypothetical protein